MTLTTARPKTYQPTRTRARATNPPTHQPTNLPTYQGQGQGNQPTNPPTYQPTRTRARATNPPTHQTQNQNQHLLDDDAATEKFMELLCAKEINGCRLVFNRQAGKFLLTKKDDKKKDKFFPLGLKWRQFCNSAAKIFDSYCENGDPHAEDSMNDHYKPFTKANAKDLIELIADYYHNGMLPDVSVVNGEFYDKESRDLQESVISFNERLSEIGERFGINIRKRPITGEATLKILGMKGSKKTTKILNMAGWQREVKECHTIWTTLECDPYAIDNYKEYAIIPANINYINKNDSSPTINRLPSDPPPPKSSPAPKESDEYYTLYDDVRNELQHYKGHFRDKIIYCNCDDYRRSNFYRYLFDNFHSLRPKKIITSCLDGVGSYTTLVNGEVERNEFPMGNGDCFGSEAVNLLKECDIVVTNPPFSKFAKFVELLDYHKKNFLIIGPLQSIGSKKPLELLKADKLWLGKTMRAPYTKYEVPGGGYENAPDTPWYTNLTYISEEYPWDLKCSYNPEKHKKLDNYDAIYVKELEDIPKDYDGNMAVMIRYMYKRNDAVFEFVDVLNEPFVEKKKKEKMVIIKRR